MSVRTMLIAALVTCVVISGCGKNAEGDARRSVVEYFTGSRGTGGKLVRSRHGRKRVDYVTVCRAICRLDKSWRFYDESFKIVDLGDREYFARYSITFRKRDVVLERVETFFFCGHTLWDPVPLTVEHMKINLSNKSGEQLEYKTLWDGDFDAFDERYRPHPDKLSPTRFHRSKGRVNGNR